MNRSPEVKKILRTLENMKGEGPQFNPIIDLKVRQLGDKMSWRTEVDSKFRPGELWLRFPDQKWLNLGKAANGTLNEFRSFSQGTISLSQVLQDIDVLWDEKGSAFNQGESQSKAASHKKRQDTSDEVHAQQDSGVFRGRPTFYLEVICSPQDVPEGAYVLPASQQRGQPANDSAKLCRIALGGAEHTSLDDFHEVSHQNNSLRIYVNSRHMLGLSVNQAIPENLKAKATKVRLRSGRLKLQGRILSKYASIADCRILLLGRQGEIVETAHVKLSEDFEFASKNYGRRAYAYTAMFDFRELSPRQLPKDVILDVWIETRESGTGAWTRTRLGNVPVLERQRSKSGGIRGQDHSLMISPYFTVKKKNLSLRLELFDTPAYDLFRQTVRNPWSSRTAKDRPIWVIGEQPDKAQDNGLHFFLFMQKEHPEIATYYVIDKEAPDARRLAGISNVLQYRSEGHIETVSKADKIIGSHHPDFLYPSRSAEFRQTVRAHKVFLQHGVIAMKWMANNYGKSVRSFECDTFIVSSETEKEYIVSDFGYPENEVAVTGLARFDRLLEKGTVPVKGRVLVMPSWRDWIQSEEDFMESDYFKKWHEFFNNSQLRDVVRKHDLELIFCLHPNMRHYQHHFIDVPARLINMDETDVQALIKDSAMMITDYSSVAFDFSFLDRPVIFYQFDHGRMFGKVRPHMNMEADLFGPREVVPEALIRRVDEAAEDGFVVSEKYRQRAARFLSFHDTNNSQRIFDEIVRKNKRRLPVVNLGVKEFFDAGFAKFRKSTKYHRLMRLIYRVISKLPPNPNLIVFESGLGKQISDSPKAIYDELIRRNDSRHLVWSYNGRDTIRGVNTSIVKRLTPKYYWYLARAKHVISSQNLPSYITRGPGRSFIQTWHGTPLKKMLYDLDVIHGRDAGYLERVTKAVQQWSVLVSASPYMTETLRSSYRYRGQVLEAGYPRNDGLVASSADRTRDEVRDSLGIGKDARVVLYAPTFRDTDAVGKSKFSFSMPFSLEAFHQEFGPETVLLLRMHMLVASVTRIPEALKSSVVDVSSYPDVQKLFLASDALVTDYSSVFFDYSLLERPIIFFAYDLDRYEENIRGFYLDYQTLPGPIVKSQADLFEAIHAAWIPDAERSEALRLFSRRYNPDADGNAAARVVDALL